VEQASDEATLDDVQAHLTQAMVEARSLLTQARRHMAREEWLEAFQLLDAAEDQLGIGKRQLILAARKGGWSWPRIGRALGVSWQAAWQRYGPSAGRRRRPPTSTPTPQSGTAAEAE